MNLIYFCIFHKSSYIELLDLLLKSLKQKGNLDKNTDLLVITHPNFVPEIKKLSSDLKIYTLTLTTLFEACHSRLNIFSYPDISKYDKILYLDSDIIINNDINLILNNNIESNILYALEEGTIESYMFGGTFFDFTKIDKNIKAFSSGILFFKNSPQIKDLFNTIQNHIAFDHYPPVFGDQPYFNYNAITLNMYNNTLLKQYAVNYDLINTEHNIRKDIVIYHFSGVPGLYVYKYPKMISFFNKITPEY